MNPNEKQLQDNEKSLFRRVYLARIEAGATVEAAEKQALHAVHRWGVLGALNDDRPDPRDQEIERLRDALVSFEGAKQALTATLANYGLSDEPKALAKQIEWLHKTNADELARLHAGFAVVREVLKDPVVNLTFNAKELAEHLGEFVMGRMTAEALREQFYSPDSGPQPPMVSETLSTFLKAQTVEHQLFQLIARWEDLLAKSPSEDKTLLESRAWRSVKEFLEQEEPATLAKVSAFLRGAKAGEELRDEDAATAQS